MRASRGSGALRGFALDLLSACASVSPMKVAPWLLLVSLLLTLGLSAVACTSIVGDACEQDVDCGTALTCDVSQPEGYCTRADCTNDECPAEGICIAFNEDTSYCMRPCLEDGDCRLGYRCETEQGAHPFCSVAAAAE